MNAVNRKKILNSQQLLSESQKNEIKKAFDFFDVTGSGTI
jgi:Ca2+-binding EF-hand superfamily protein